LRHTVYSGAAISGVRADQDGNGRVDDDDLNQIVRNLGQ